MNVVAWSALARCTDINIEVTREKQTKMENLREYFITALATINSAENLWQVQK